jgi:16S rRNA (cytosine1402-N4)-methyltransferase
MVDEILSFIHGEEELSILDCTFGGGGHAQNFLDKGHYVTAIDQDKNAINSAQELSKRNSKLSFYKINFKDIDKINEEKNHDKFNLILVDLGFSSNQLENENIGISFKINSKLNMNYLDGDITAHEIINNYNIDELTRVFKEYGEIIHSKKLSEFIIKTRSKKTIDTNFELIEVIRNSGINFRSKKIHFATQAFQALRIEANREIINLNKFLNNVHSFIKKKGYLAIISFHSLEDRVVKNYFKSNCFRKNYFFNNNLDWGYEILTKRPLTPSKSEIKQNNRARSAKLRVGKFIN